MPDPNPGRQTQIFQIWIRPVEAENGVFERRAALCEYDKLVRNGISKTSFEVTWEFLSEFSNVLTQTQSARLGCALDNRYYGIADYGTCLKSQLAKLAVDEVNAAIRRNLKSESMRVVIVTKNGEAIRDAIVKNVPSPITCNSPRPAEITEEHKIIQTYRVNVKPEDVTILRADQIFQ